MSKFVYKIGDKNFYQQELVMGQLKKVNVFMENIKVSLDNFGPKEFVNFAGNDLIGLFDIILIPDGKAWKDIKNLSKESLEERKEIFEDNITTSLGLTIMTDFFVINKVSGITERITAMAKEIFAPSLEKEQQ